MIPIYQYNAEISSYTDGYIRARNAKEAETKILEILKWECDYHENLEINRVAKDEEEDWMA